MGGEGRLHLSSLCACWYFCLKCPSPPSKPLPILQDPAKSRLHCEAFSSSTNVFQGNLGKCISRSPHPLCISQGSTRQTQPVGAILQDLLQGTGLGNCGGWVSASKIWRAGHQEGQAETLWNNLKLQSTGKSFLFFRATSDLLFKAFHLTDQAHLGNLRYLKATDRRR